MKKLLLSILLICACFVIAQAQGTKSDPKPAEPPPRIEVTPEVAQAFVASQAKVAAAEAQLRAARLEQENLLLRAARQYGVPLDYEPRIDRDGRLYFEKPPQK